MHRNLKDKSRITKYSEDGMASQMEMNLTRGYRLGWGGTSPSWLTGGMGSDAYIVRQRLFCIILEQIQALGFTKILVLLM